MLKLPFFEELEHAQNILISGAGGGFDIFSGLPLYFGLKAAGKQVHLANLSFSFLPPDEFVNEERLSPTLLKVTADTPLLTNYFPEMYLAQWFRDQGTETPIYCFERTGVRPLLYCYRKLVDHLTLDTVILVDGGSDSLMRGDEIVLGTPQEDISSITAVNELTRNQGYFGMFSLVEDMPEVQKYGDYHATPRTRNSILWINPLMPVYWCFRLSAVARRVLYLDAMKSTDSFDDVNRVIREFRKSCGKIRPREEIPV
jgi:hypothetical protein